jgi:hypothetical protein
MTMERYKADAARRLLTSISFLSINFLIFSIQVLHSPSNELQPVWKVFRHVALGG